MPDKQPQHLPSSSLSDSIFPSSLKISPQTKKLSYRLFFCCISIGLLWITTLDLAINIVQYSIPSPTTQAVIDTCRSAYYRTTAERQSYELCANIQSQQCHNDFENSLIREIDRNNDVLDFNAAVNVKVKLHQQSCQGNLDITMDALASWGNQKSDDPRAQSLTYYPTCSISDRTKVATLIGTILTSDTGPSPTEIKKSSLQTALEYTQSTATTLQSFSDYSITLSRYNQGYLDNHTRINYPQLTSNFVRDVSSPSVKYLTGTDLNSLALSSTIKTHINSLLACVSLNPTLAGKCTLLPTSAFIEYNKIKTEVNILGVRMQNDINSVRKYVVSYGLVVKDMLVLANDFFDSVTGSKLFSSSSRLTLTLSLSPSQQQ
jgi:hypothetical protein